jgi:hypothetical protein
MSGPYQNGKHLRNVIIADMLHVTLKELKGKIILPHHGPNQRLFLDSDEQEKQQDDPPTLYRLMRQWRRQQSRHICKVQDGDRNTYTSSRDILRVFTAYLKHMFDLIMVEINTIHAILEGVEVQLPHEANTVLQTPITKEELQLVVMRGKKLKAPGYDGLCNELFQLAWPIISDDLLTIMINMFIEGAIVKSQTQGVILYVPKKQGPTTPYDYRPLTLLNSDTKLLALILAHRKQLWLNDVIRSNTVGYGTTVSWERLLQ